MRLSVGRSRRNANALSWFRHLNAVTQVGDLGTTGIETTCFGERFPTLLALLDRREIEPEPPVAGILRDGLSEARTCTPNVVLCELRRAERGAGIGRPGHETACLSGLAFRPGQVEILAGGLARRQRAVPDQPEER